MIEPLPATPPPPPSLPTGLRPHVVMLAAEWVNITQGAGTPVLAGVYAKMRTGMTVVKGGRMDVITIPTRQLLMRVHAPAAMSLNVFLLVRVVSINGDKMDHPCSLAGIQADCSEPPWSADMPITIPNMDLPVPGYPLAAVNDTLIQYEAWIDGALAGWLILHHTVERQVAV